MADIDLSDLTGPAPDVDLSDLETEISPVVVEGRPLRWRDVPVEAIQNIPESGGRLVKGLWETVKHPIKTGAALVDLAAGAQSLIPGWEPPRNLREFQDQADSINLGREWANRSREKKGLPLLPMVTTQELQQQFIANRERQRGMARSVWQDLVDRYGSADALKYTLARIPSVRLPMSPPSPSPEALRPRAPKPLVWRARQTSLREAPRRSRCSTR